MNKESLDKMNRMRLLGMHHAFETSIETHQVESFTNDETGTPPGAERMG